MADPSAGRRLPAVPAGRRRAILLGLEFLVGGDIIRTVAAPSFTSIGVLALIVLVRTFLSFSLQVELDGRWPWQTRAPHRDRLRNDDR